MPRFIEQQNSFSSGQLAPVLEGRSDLKEYSQGVAELTNFIPLKTGGVTRRPGVEIVSAAVSSVSAPLLSMLGSNEREYVILPSWTLAGGLAFNIRRRNINFSLGTLCGVDRSAKVETYAADAPLGVIDDTRIRAAQSGDVLVITGITQFATNKAYEPVVLTRIGEEDFTAKTWTEWATGTFAKEWETVAWNETNLGSTTLALTGAAALTATMTAASVPAGVTFFTAEDVGRMVQIVGLGAVFIPYKITGYTSATQVTVTRLDGAAAANIAATTSWRLASWSTRTGWPRVLTFHRQRLLFANTAERIDTIWCSRNRNIAYFMGVPLTTTGLYTFTAADAFELIAASDTIAAIQWLWSGKYLDVGTTTAEFAAIDGQDGFTNAGTSISRVSSFGSAFVQPVQVGSSIVFVDASGTSLREIVYDTDKESNITNDLTLLSGNTDPLLQLVHDNDSSTIWARTALGIKTVTLDLAGNGVLAWATQILGTGAPTSILSLKGRIELAIQGTIPKIGRINTRRINYPTDDGFNSNHTKNADDSIAHVAVDGTTILAGAAFANATLAVFQGGLFVGTLNYDENGTADLAGQGYQYQPNDTVILGRPFTSTLETLPIDLGAMGGAPATSFNSPLRLDRVSIRVHNSKPFKVGTEPTDLKQTLSPTESGLVSIQVQNKPDYDRKFYVVQENPLPLTITALIYRGVSLGE